MHRVGIIPFEIKEDAVAILFVTSSSRERWILPKGKVKPDESRHDACHREGFEEAGVKGVLLEEFPTTVVIEKQTLTELLGVPVTYFPFLVLEQADTWPEQEKRQRHWASIEEASDVARFDDYLNVVRLFQDLQPWVIQAAREHEQRQQELLLQQQ